MTFRLPSLSAPWLDRLTLFSVVLIALALVLGMGAAIDALQWHSRATQAAGRVELELRDNLLFLAERTVIAPCIGHRLDALEIKLAAAGDKWTPVAPMVTSGIATGDVIAVPLRPWNGNAWTVAQADGTARHMEDGPRLAFGRLSALVARAEDVNEAEYDIAARLNLLAKPVALSSDTIARMVELIESERAHNRMMALFAAEAMSIWRQTGHDPKELMTAVRKRSPSLKACAAAGGT